MDKNGGFSIQLSNGRTVQAVKLWLLTLPNNVFTSITHTLLKICPLEISLSKPPPPHSLAVFPALSRHSDAACPLSKSWTALILPITG